MGSKFTSLTNADLLAEGNNFTICKFQPSSTFCNKISYILGTQNEQKLATCMHTLSYFYGMGSPLHDLQSNLGSLSYGIREGCHKTKQVFTFSYLTVQYSHHPSLTKERSNSQTQESASQLWNKREGCHKTIQIFTFSYSIVQYSHHPSLARERERAQSQESVRQLRNKRELPQNKTNIHLLLFNSPVQPSSKLGKKQASVGNTVQ